MFRNCLSLALLSALVFQSQARIADAERAIILKNVEVIVFGVDETGDLDAGLLEITTDTSLIETERAASLRARAEVLNLSGEVQNYEGFQCRIYIPSEGIDEISTDTRFTISPDGRATLDCVYVK